MVAAGFYRASVIESDLATKKCIADALFLSGSWASCYILDAQPTTTKHSSFVYWSCLLMQKCVYMSSVTLVHPAKAAERNEMPFGRDTHVVPSIDHVYSRRYIRWSRVFIYSIRMCLCVYVCVCVCVCVSSLKQKNTWCIITKHGGWMTSPVTHFIWGQKVNCQGWREFALFWVAVL